MTDPFSTFDAAYVLGALSPEDRAAFEQHLPTCVACAAAVREVAGLPGLLARATPPTATVPPPEPRPASPESSDPAPDPAAASQPGSSRPGPAGPARDASDATGSADEPGASGEVLLRSLSEPPPAELLTGVLRRVRRGRRWRNAVALGSAGIAVAACVALGVVASSAPTPPPPLTAMQTLGEYPVQAAARFDDQSWGTQVAMSCSYEGGHGGAYTLVAITRDGAVSVLATWQALPEETAHMVVGTPLRRADIQALEIRTPTGHPLLRLTP